MDKITPAEGLMQRPDAGVAKLEHFTSVIVADAMAESKSIYDAIRKETQEAMSAAEDEALADAFRYIKTEISKINTECGRRLSLSLMEKKHERHRLRTEMSDDVFAEVLTRLEEYTHTPAYKERMQALLTEILALFDADAIVYLREEDAALEPELAGLPTPHKISFKRGYFILGGLEASCPTRKLHIDESFDAKVKDLRGHFSNMFGLKLDDTPGMDV